MATDEEIIICDYCRKQIADIKYSDGTYACTTCDSILQSEDIKG